MKSWLNVPTPPGSQTRMYPRPYANQRLAFCPWTNIALPILVSVYLSVEISDDHVVSQLPSGIYQHLLHNGSQVGFKNGLLYRRRRRHTLDLCPSPSRFRTAHRNRQITVISLLLPGIYAAVLVRYPVRHLGRNTRSVMCHTPEEPNPQNNKSPAQHKAVSRSTYFAQTRVSSLGETLI